MIRLNSRLATVSYVVSAVLLSSFAASAEGFDGPWSRNDGIVRATVAPCGGKMCMTNTWVKPGVTDEKVGEKVVFDVKPEANGSFKGSGFDPQRNVTFSVNIKVAGDSMITSGCALGGLVCKSRSWTRSR